MENLIHAIVKRVKRSLPFIIIIPLLLAGLGYFFETNSKSVITYRGEAVVSLGYYDDMNLNESETAKPILLNYSFLNDLFKSYTREEIEEIKSTVKVDTPSSSRMSISYEGESEEKVREVLTTLVEGFLAYDSENFEEKQSVLETNFRELEKETVSQAAKVEKQRFIYELQTDLLAIYPAELAEPIKVNEFKMEDFSAKKRAVLGGLIGVSIAFAYVAIPILFREETL
ncbi:GumC domain-containing protein [Sutcliffiella horikoshii]|uniref:hypothetical protein n=1 Tax=Sutcliffiella horikoshii TaxID=79883 RepID=UPI001CFD2FCA|nr:hypothetical protein [Sutcliffiella horikoshii]